MTERSHHTVRVQPPLQFDLLGPDLTREEVAAWLRCSLGTVDELVNRNVLKSYKLGADKRSARRIRRDSVLEVRDGQVE